MKRLQKFILILTCLCAPLAAQAQTTGTVSGRVTDAGTELPLAGVRVSIDATSLETYTGNDGFYLLSQVPLGDQSLTFSYVGYPSIDQTVVVLADGMTKADAIFGDEVISMDQFVIKGVLVGTARAINQQRASDTLRNIVAADEIGNFPDENAAEALQRVPGLALYRDQGEGRYIIVRGVNYALNSVTLNGVKLASTESGDRGIALDVIPSDALSSVEVTKVATPDMDGEGFGGTGEYQNQKPL